MNEIFKISLPTLTTLVAIFITYRFGLRRVRFEERENELKKRRTTISNLLLIWNELTRLKVLTEAVTPIDRFLVELPDFAKGYLEISKNKIEQLQDAYLSSLNAFKEINVLQYYQLERNYNTFNYILSELLMPVTKDRDFNLMQKSNIALPALIVLHKDFEILIRTTGKALKRKELIEIEAILKQGKKVNDDPAKIPPFILAIINKNLPFQHQVEENEIVEFYNDATVLWVLRKILTPEFSKLIPTRNFFHGLKLMLVFVTNDGTKKRLFVKFLRALQASFAQMSIAEQERIQFINNKKFYFLLMGFIQKVNGKVSFQTRRLISQINSGKLPIDEIIENAKLDLALQLNKFTELEMRNSSL